jgi:hypothetical protein
MYVFYAYYNEKWNFHQCMSCLYLMIAAITIVRFSLLKLPCHAVSELILAIRMWFQAFLAAQLSNHYCNKIKDCSHVLLQLITMFSFVHFW